MLKKILFFFMIILFNSCSDTLVEDKLIVIPDSNFEQLLIDQGIDSDGILNGMVLETDISAVIYLPLSDSNISDLSGIENFVNLKKLDCFNNQLTSLDVSQNKALIELNCRYNQLTSLDVSQNTGLTSLLCAGNELTSLDVNQNTALETLGCTMNRISSLNVSQNTALTLLYCSENKLTNLDVSQNIKLIELFFWNNKLTSLDVSLNTALTELYCFENQIKNLDLSKNTALTTISCGNNELMSLNVKNGNNLIITAFNAIGNIELQCIQVDDDTAANQSQSTYNKWIKDTNVTYSEDCTN